jgi:hypothetical protein
MDILDILIIIVLVIITYIYITKQKSETFKINKPLELETIEPLIQFNYKEDKIKTIENNILLKTSELDFPYTARIEENVNPLEQTEELELNLNKLYNSSSEANIDELYDYLTSI